MIQFSESYNAQTIFEQVWEAPYTWFGLTNAKSIILPTWVDVMDGDGQIYKSVLVTVEMIEEAVIKYYLEYVSKRTGNWATPMSDYLEDMDANDVDCILQLAVFEEIRYS